MVKVQAIIDQAADIGIKAQLWQRDTKMRIYVTTGRKDMKVYLELDGTPEDVSGAAFKVFCETDARTTKMSAMIEA